MFDWIQDTPLEKKFFKVLTFLNPLIKFVKLLKQKQPSRGVLRTWMFSCKFAAYFQNTFPSEHLWTAASVKGNLNIFVKNVPCTIKFYVRQIKMFNSMNCWASSTSDKLYGLLFLIETLIYLLSIKIT